MKMLAIARNTFREALRAADFASTRGDFAFGPNHHPIQDIYVREVIKEGDVYTNKIIGVALEDRADALQGPRSTRWEEGIRTLMSLAHMLVI